MGLVHGSKSLLLDRTVCVQRRLVRDDGMGGTYQDWQTVSNSYWVRIYPDQHQERRTREVGESALNSTHRAIGQPLMNGRSLMVGDRFYDGKNNETYDLVGVIRPRYKLPYHAMHQFVLRIVKDDGLQYGQCGGTGTFTSGGGTSTAEADEEVTSEEAGGESGETHLILRDFQIVDMNNIEGNLVDYGSYDAFIYAHTGVQEGVVQSLIAAGKRCFRYFEVMTFPEAGFDDDWLTWWRAQGQVAWDFGLVNGAGDPAVFRLAASGCNDRQFVDWSLIKAAERQMIADKMFELAPNSGLFLDQAWVKESPFFFFSEPTSGGACGACAYCATYASIPASKWLDWQASIMAFYALVDAMAADRGQWVIKNGEHRTIGTPAQQTPRPIYYEDSANNNLEQNPKFQNSVIGWKQHPKNVLDINVPDPVNLPLLLTEFDQRGGWVAFGGAASSAAVQNAYAQAAGVKAAH